MMLNRILGAIWVFAGLTWSIMFLRSLIWSVQSEQVNLSFLWASMVILGLFVILSGGWLIVGKRWAPIVLAALSVPLTLYGVAYVAMVGSGYGIVPLVAVGVLLLLGIYTFIFGATHAKSA